MSKITKPIEDFNSAKSNADLTINAIGIIPGGPLQMKEASHE